MNGKSKIFLKNFLIRVIRNRIIDPNTKNFLDDGFNYLDEDTGINTTIPCDDSNWCEYQTYNEGFKLGVLQFPFSLKLHNNYFKELNNYEEFLKILKLVIDYRNDVIKRGWAIKYGFEFQGKEYPELEALSEKELINWVDPRPHARWSLNDARKEWFE